MALSSFVRGQQKRKFPAALLNLQRFSLFFVLWDFWLFGTLVYSFRFFFQKTKSPRFTKSLFCHLIFGLETLLPFFGNPLNHLSFKKINLKKVIKLIFILHKCVPRCSWMMFPKAFINNEQISYQNLMYEETFIRLLSAWKINDEFVSWSLTFFFKNENFKPLIQSNCKIISHLMGLIKSDSST